MQERALLKMDSLFSNAFYQFKNTHDMEIAVKFPVPKSADGLANFLTTKDGRDMKDACRQAINELTEWSKLNQIDPAPLIKFKENFIEYSGVNADENRRRMPFYTEGLPSFVRMIELVRTSDVSLDFRKDLIKNLLTSLAVCAPGTYTNIINAYLDIVAQMNTPMKWMTLRKRIAEQYVEELLHPLGISIGMEIHYVNGVVNRFADAIGVQLLKDDYVDLCQPRLLQILFDLFGKNISTKITPTFIIDSIISEIEYEKLPGKINNNIAVVGEAVAELENKLACYGKEGERQFYFANELLDSEDYVIYQLSWRAKYVIYQSIIQRLRVSGYLENIDEEVQIGKFSLHLLLPHSLKFSYVYHSHDPEGKFYKPFLIFCVDSLVQNNREIEDYIMSGKFEDSHRFEIINAIGEYVTSLDQKENKDEVSMLSNKIIKFIPDHLSWQILSMSITVEALTLYVNAVDMPKLTKFVNSKDILNKILSVMIPTSVTAFLLLLNKQGNHNIDTHTLLWFAARHGNMEAVNALLSVRPQDIDKPNRNGEMPLFAAAQYGHADIVRALIKVRGVGVNRINKDGQIPLYIAAQQGRIEVVRALVDNKGMVDKPAKNGEAPLYAASANGHAAVVRFLLQHHANPHQKNTIGETAFCVAVRMNQLDVLVELLTVEKNADQLNQFNETLLCMAVTNKNFNIVKRLLLQGANPNVVDKTGNPIFTLAIEQGAVDIAELLLAHGADVHYTSGKGKNALHAAIARGYVGIANAILSQGMSAGVLGENNESALQLAVRLDQSEMALLLMANSVDVNSVKNGGASPFYMAASLGNIDIANGLLACHAHVEARTVNGLTPLCAAVQAGHYKMVKLLLMNGADREIKIDNKSLDVVAHERAYVDIEQYLQLQKMISVFLSPMDSPRSHAIKYLESVIDTQPNKFNEQYKVFQSLNIFEKDYLECKPKTDNDIIMVKQLRSKLDAAYQSYILSGKFSEKELMMSMFKAAIMMGPVSLVDAIVSQGIPINAVFENGETSLQLAVQSEKADFVQFLLSKGADVNQSGNGTVSPLYLAVTAGNTKIASLLLAKGADIERRTVGGLSPLCAAVSAGHFNMVRLLLANGADRHVKVNDKSLIFLAQEAGFQNIAQLLMVYNMKLALPLSLDSPRSVAFAQLETLVELHPEQFDKVHKTFLLLDSFEKLCFDHKPKNAKEVLILQKIRHSVNAAYLHYLDFGEPHHDIIVELQRQSKLIMKAVNPHPKLQRFLSIFGVKNSFSHEVEMVIQPAMRL